jgi:hypothetical protein
MYVMALFLLLHALPQSQSGTIVATEFSDERLIIAADSRGTDEYGKPITNCNCKIHVIGESLVFVGAGKDSIVYNGMNLVDGAAAAVRVRRDNKTASVERIAQLWAQQMKIDLGKVGTISREMLLKGLDTEMIVHGIFGGIADHGGITAYNAAVVYKLSGDTVILSVKVEPLGHGLRGFTNHTDLLQEFFGHNTKRGIDWNAKLEKELDAKHISDYEPYRLIAGVEAAIKWANDKRIGGDVDGLILNKGGKIVWVKKKKNCDCRQQQ